MAVIKERHILRDILLKYKECQCLWDTAHEFYTNKVRRNEAVAELLKIYRVYEPDAQQYHLKRKIENMRTCFKREHAKVVKSRMMGDEEHVPTLWYYDLLLFLNKEETPSQDKLSYLEDEVEDIQNDDYELKVEDLHSSPPPKKKRNALKNNIIYLAEDEHNETEQYTEEEQFQSETLSAESFGKTIGLQLNELKPLQRFVAEKLISEVIFYGRLDKLLPNSTLRINNDD